MLLCYHPSIAPLLPTPCTDIMLIVLTCVCAIYPQHMSPQNPHHLVHNEASVVTDSSAERLLTPKLKPNLSLSPVPFSI